MGVHHHHHHGRYPSAHGRRNRIGFTLVELLVVIAIISILVGLLLPAVQAVREAARKTQCQNNIRQISLGVLNFESTYKKFPSNGWGYSWAPEPARGAGLSQPGGWIYQILPQLEESNVWAIGNGSTGANRRQAMGKLLNTPITTFACPSRPGEISGPLGSAVRYVNATPANVARTDYAINEGDWISDSGRGPGSLDIGDSGRYRWADFRKITGIAGMHFAIKMAEIRDGSSNTYLVGEKHVGRDSYDNAGDPGYDQSMYSGVDVDVARWSVFPPARDSETSLENARRFGSAHSSVFHMAMCDSSIRRVSYQIDATVHRWLGNRKDGNNTAQLE